MTFFLLLKFAVVAFFLVMFLRGSKPIWGVGLLTVTSALLFDTFLGTFGQDEMQAELGFFFYVISGALFAGAALWLWALLRPLAGGQPADWQHTAAQPGSLNSAEALPPANGDSNLAYDRRMLFDQIHYRLAPDDILDLIFDLGMNENDIIGLNQDMNQIIINLMDLAEQRGQANSLALAVERILTPLPKESLPRLEKLSIDTPANVLRHYLIAHYTLADLQSMVTGLEIDWELLSGDSKKAKVRNLLLYLDRRNRLEELLDLVQAPALAS